MNNGTMNSGRRLAGSEGGIKSIFRILTGEQREKIAAAAFELLERVGVRLTEPEAQAGQYITRYPVPGNNEVAQRGGYPKYTSPGGGAPNPQQAIGGRVHINEKQYFEGVPQDVWEFQVGGYKVLHKWLKDRRGRLLTFDDLTHYQKIVTALQQTMRLMAEIDRAIPQWPIQ